MEEAGQVAVPPREQPLQEADVAALGRDEQSHTGRVLCRLQRKG